MNILIKFIFRIFLLIAIYQMQSMDVFSQHKNIKISDENSPEETMICLNPKKPNVMVAAANTENYYFSSDTGKTWRHQVLKSSFGVWGDPSLIIDSTGCFYYFHLSKMENSNSYDRLICQKSYDKGITWTNGTYLGLNGNFTQDKELAAIDPKTNYIYVLWTEEKKNMGRNGITITDINASVSKDKGKTWSKGMKINEKSGANFDEWKTVIGGMPAVGLNSEIYATWVSNEGIFFTKSLDTGKTWMSKNVKISPLAEDWHLTIPGMYRCYIFPIIACDNSSSSPYKGSVYITWSDKKKGKSDTDIWLVKSTDEGQSWTKPVKVNNDSTSRYQYFPWIAVDQTNGYVYLVFYDRRNYKDGKTDVYMARSTDGGKTFINFKVNERSFTPESSVFMGDYIGLIAYNNIVRPIWTSMDEHNGLSVWTAIVNVNAIK